MVNIKNKIIRKEIVSELESNYEYLKDGFKKAFEISLEEDIILLSPASASWDQYKECEDRGDEFKKLVEELKDGSIKK